jgi:hypothetical protein
MSRNQLKKSLKVGMRVLLKDKHGRERNALIVDIKFRCEKLLVDYESEHQPIENKTPVYFGSFEASYSDVISL